MSIYKYRSKQKGLEILNTQRIIFTKASKLNDPFESDYRTLLEMSLERKEESVKKAVGLDQHLSIKRMEQNDLRDSFALFCMSRVPDNVLMWSHYAENHQGMVLGFSEVATFLGEPYYGRCDEDLKEEHITGKKEYRKNLLVHYSNIKYVKLFATPDIEPFGWKSLAWNYEEEFRVVRFLPEPTKDDLSEGFGNNDLIEIYFGVQFDKKEIAEIKAKNDKAKKYPKARYYQMELNNENYLLDKKEIV